MFTDLYGTPSVLAYSVLLNLAPDYPKGRAVLDEMIAADVTPNAVTWNTLLNLTPDYPTGRAVLDQMIAADVTPNAVTASTMAKLVRSVAEADALTDEMLGFGAANPGFFNTIVSRIHPLLSGAELLGWVFGKAKAFKFPPIFSLRTRDCRLSQETAVRRCAADYIAVPAFADIGCLSDQPGAGKIRRSLLHSPV